MRALIYLITSSKNPEKYYIGSTVDFLVRTNKHLKDLKKNKHDCEHLQRAANKYGKETKRNVATVGT